MQETAITFQSYSLVGYEKSNHCMAGKPSYFGKNDIGPTEYVSRVGYELLHSAVFKGPYWVCESYTRRSLVSLYDRAGLDFSEDPQIKLDHATKSDYRDRTDYGFHIGHMAPAEAHTSTSQRLLDTFYYSNAVPQNSSLNGGMWAQVELCARDSTPSGGRAWVITGPAYAPEQDEALTYIGDHLYVPTHVWKIVIAKEPSGLMLAWAIMAPNRTLPEGYKYSDYAVSIDEIEQATGFDFFSEMPAADQKPLESTTHRFPCRK